MGNKMSTVIRTHSIAVFACTSKACAPPPVGTGGSNPSGVGGGSSASGAGGTAVALDKSTMNALDGPTSALSHDDLLGMQRWQRASRGKEMAVAAVADEVMSDPEAREIFTEMTRVMVGPSKEPDEDVVRLVVEREVNRMLADWAESSNSGSHSQRRQAAATVVHGLPESDDSDRVHAAAWAQLDPKGFAEAVALTRAEYRATQKFLAKAVPSGKLIVARGTRGQYQGVKKGDTVEVESNPLSSWSTSFSVAASPSFGGGKNGVVLGMEVPISQVQSVWRTGRGCMTEFEAVLIGHPSTARVLKTD